MSTVTRAHYEPFLAPSHAMPAHALDSTVMTTDPYLIYRHAKHAMAIGDSSSSAVSPLALPRDALAYFDRAIPVNNSLAVPRQSSAPTTIRLTTLSSTAPAVTPTPTPSVANGSAPSAARNGYVFSPLQLAVRGPFRAQPSQFFSPRLAPVLDRELQRQTQRQQRSASLSPTRVRGARTKMRSVLSAASSTVPSSFDGFGSAASAGGAYISAAIPLSDPRPLSLSPDGSCASQQLSLSAETASASSHLQTIRRLVQQNGRMREAWEAERKYLEANRERAEEVYKEERELMEEERDEWEAEKACLLEQIGRLQHQVLGLGNIPELREPASKKVAFALGPNGVGEDSTSSSRESQKDQQNANASAGRGAGDASDPPTTTAVPFQQYTSGKLLHPTDLDQQHLQHHPPASASTQISPTSHPTHSTTSATEAMASTDDQDAEPGPIVDVQEIHPDLEGIPIKATTFQKPTFTDGHSSTSGSNAPSQASSPNTIALNRPWSPKRSHSDEQTLNVLAAKATERLTMYAGHTPSHSLSLLPSVFSTRTHTAGSSGSSTPTARAEDDDAALLAPAPICDNLPPAALGHVDENSEDHVSTEQQPHAEEEGNPESALEDAGERPLKGPLMVRNMPAHDEIFFRRLSDKLEVVSKVPEEALPTVLKESPEVDDSVAGDPAEILARQEVEGTDEKSKSGSGSGGEDEAELEIPLKFKKNINFGAPFGTFR